MTHDPMDEDRVFDGSISVGLGDEVYRLGRWHVLLCLLGVVMVIAFGSVWLTAAFSPVTACAVISVIAAAAMLCIMVLSGED